MSSRRRADFSLMCMKRGTSEPCGLCGGGLATFSQGLLAEQTRRAQGAETCCWGLWLRVSRIWGGGVGVSGPLVLLMVENCLSRNLNPGEEGGKTKTSPSASSVRNTKRMSYLICIHHSDFNSISIGLKMDNPPSLFWDWD